MTLQRRILPTPAVSFAILALWLVLAPQPSLGHLLLGSVFAVAIPRLTKAFWPDPPHIKRPLLGIVLFIKLVGDILAANWHVARLVVGPLDRLRPEFVEVPLDISHPFVATLLGSVVSLTPGTVSIEIDMDAKRLFVHALDVADREQLIATIKSRYEAPLKEIFAC